MAIYRNFLAASLLIGSLTGCGDDAKESPELVDEIGNQALHANRDVADDQVDALIADPLVPSSAMPALPGLDDYDLSHNLPPNVRFPISRASVSLAAERIDFEWAREMQDRIFETANEIDAPISIVDVQCRTTWCGIVADVLNGDRTVRWKVRDRLQEVFDVEYTSSHGKGSNGSDWIAVYVQIAR